MLSLQKCIFHVCKQIVLPRPTVYLDEHIPVRLHLGLSFPFVLLLLCHERHGIFFFHHALPMEFRNYLAGRLALSCWYKIECPRISSELQEVVASHWHLSQRAKTVWATAVLSVTVAHSLKKLFVKCRFFFILKQNHPFKVKLSKTHAAMCHSCQAWTVPVTTYDMKSTHWVIIDFLYPERPLCIRSVILHLSSFVRQFGFIHIPAGLHPPNIGCMKPKTLYCVSVKVFPINSEGYIISK